MSTEFELFSKKNIIGVFKGFSKGGLEFRADLVLPYRDDFQSIPMHGQFLLVQLENPNEAVLGRITSLSSSGKLSSGIGEEFNIRAAREGRDIPEDLREQFLKYEIEIRVLGVLRRNFLNKLVFVASHRRLPHVGSPVAFPSGEVLREIANHNVKGAEIGHFALGEYIYAEQSNSLKVLDWMQVKSPEVLVRFPIDHLVSRRSFIFARAGFGKSNLNKLLLSKLYAKTPMVKKRGNKEVPVGTILFDPDGEYFWPDDKGRPGLCDVPVLEDKLVVFTNRKAPSEFYQSFVAGGIKLDIRRLKPADVISITVSPEKQDQQNIRKLRGLSQQGWEKLVELIDEHKYHTPDEEIAKLLSLKESDEAQINAARANMTVIVSTLHDRRSQLMDLLMKALEQGKLCVIDVSQMRGAQSLMLSSLILRYIFDRNQQEFTAADPKTIPTIAIVEEAQAVLNERAAGSEPYIAWVKEGRKYDLGAVLITQQPGSIPNEILSQGDNWFVFHLLSATDLQNIKKANAHFSDDLLSTLLNEPLRGQGMFWSSASNTPFPIAIRVLSFEEMYKCLDPDYTLPAGNTFAKELKTQFEKNLKRALSYTKDESQKNVDDIDVEEMVRKNDGHDPKKIYEEAAIKALAENERAMQQIENGNGYPWGKIVEILKNALPESNYTESQRQDDAYHLVPKALTRLFGPEKEGWEKFRFANPQQTLAVRKTRKM